jgi:sugar O-acyltransferase (sialic acid O-acetyltransferase NeuD family)
MDDCQLNLLPPKIILWGGTGQAKVVRPIIEHYGSKVVAVFDDTPNLPPPFPDVPLHLGREGFHRWITTQNRAELGFCITIGNPHGRVRLKFHDLLITEGLRPISIAHPTAYIAKNAVVGPGAQIMAGAIIAAEARLGRQVIINTKASADHEDVLEDGTELAPGVTLCGLVTRKTNAWVCAGATVLPRLTIGEDAVVGPGSLVIRDVPARTTVFGVPATQGPIPHGERTLAYGCMRLPEAV